MDSLPAIELPAPPRLARAVGLQMLALIGLALIAALPWPRARQAQPQPRPEPKKEERRIRVVQIPRPPPPVAKADPQPAKSAAPAQPRPPQPPPAMRAPAPHAAAPIARIAADSTAVQGVRMRVLVPRSPGDLAEHLRNSGGCLVVSRLTGGEAEVLSVLALEGGRAVETAGAPCGGIPRLVRDAALNLALGDPIAKVRAASPGDDLVLQVLLSPALQHSARSALLSRFGDVSDQEMGRLAAEAGYELTCFAEPAGALRCQ
jgi:hypothetical protein